MTNTENKSTQTTAVEVEETTKNAVKSDFLERVLKIPVVVAVKEYSTAFYNQVKQMNSFTAAVLSVADMTALYFAIIAKPVLEKIAPLVQLVDKLACLILDACLPSSSAKKCSMQKVNETLDGHDLEEIDRYLSPAFGKTFEKSDELKQKSDLSYYINNNTDCILQVGDRQFPAHKCFLSISSSVFASRLCNCTGKKDVIVIDDVDADVFYDFLLCMYSGNVSRLNSKTVVLMLELAVKFKVLFLKDLCLKYFKYLMNVRNICVAAMVADTHEDTELCEMVSLFIKNHIREIQETDAWKNFVMAKPSIAKKFFCSVAS